MAHTTTLSATVAIAFVAAVLPTSQAMGEAVVNERYEFSYAGVQEDFCDVEGLTVEQSGTAEGRFLVVARGRDGVEYEGDRARFSDTYTNVETGASVTDVGLYNGQVLSVTDSGEGTVTVELIYAGTGSTYDADGDRINMTAGVRRVQLVFDEQGELVSRSIETHGMGTGFCDAVVEAIG